MSRVSEGRLESLAKYPGQALAEGELENITAELRSARVVLEKGVEALEVWGDYSRSLRELKEILTTHLAQFPEEE